MTIPTLSGDDSDLGFGLSDVRRMFGGRRGGRRPGYYAPPPPRGGLPAPLVVAPGGVRPQPGLYPISMPAFQFTNATGLADIQLQINPQVNFKAQRMMVTVIRSAGVTSVPLLKRGFVGIKPIVLGGAPVAIEQFSNVAVDANLSFPQTRPGLLYDLTIGLDTALGAGATLTVLITFTGTAYQ